MRHATLDLCIDASSCSFEDGTLCGWMIQGGWIASEAGTVSSSAVDETYMNSTGTL